MPEWALKVLWRLYQATGILFVIGLLFIAYLGVKKLISLYNKIKEEGKIGKEE